MKYIYNVSKSKNPFTKAMKDYVEKRFSSLERQLKENETIKFSLETFSRGNKPLILKCQAVSQDNKHIRAECSSNDFYLAVDELKDKINSLARKHRNKIVNKPLSQPNEYPLDVKEIVKTKQIVLESISVEQAIKEANELGHAWYVFRNAEENDMVCVLYRRFEGNYGLMICR